MMRSSVLDWNFQKKRVIENVIRPRMAVQTLCNAVGVGTWSVKTLLFTLYENGIIPNYILANF